MLQENNITRRLIIGFSFLILTYLVFGLYSLYDIRTLSGLTRTIYNHPLVVSNAALQSNVAITKMHRDMKDIVLFKSTSRIQNTIAAVDQQEQLVYQYLDIVRDRILGAEGKKLEKGTRTLFKNWHPIRKEVIVLVRNGQNEKAAEITIGKGADHVAKLEEKMIALTNYAKSKATSFMSESESTHSRLNVSSIVFLVIVISLSAIISIFTLKRTASAENGLRESRQLLLNAIDYAPTGIVLVEPSGTFNKVNEAFCKMTGYSEKELLMMGFQEITHPDDYDVGSNVVKQLLEGKLDQTTLEKRYVKKDGDVIDVYLATSLLRDAKGMPLYFFSQVQDVTERKQALEEIRSAMSFIDRVVDMSPFAMWISDRNGTVIRTNSSLRKTLNLTDDEIVGQYNVLKDENLEIQGVMPMVMAVFENHEPANFSIPWEAAKAGDVNFNDALDLCIDVSIFPIVSAEGELTNAVCQWVDITDLKKAEESLRESHEKFKSIVDNIGIGVALISPAMEILEMNHQMRQWFPDIDLDNSPICYRTLNNPPREEICEYCPTCKTLEDGKVHEGTTATPQGNKTRNYRVVSSPLTNSQGEVTAAIEMVEDITERLNLQAQLIQSQKMESVGRLAGGVAHDYNNISSIIIGFSELALEKVEQDDPVHDDLMEIYTAANRSTDITRQLLAFARQQTIAPKVLDMNDIIESMLKMLRRLIGEDIDLAWLPGAEVWPVKLDPSQVDQIMANLCVNARDAIADVGKVTIETKNISFDEDYCADHAGFVLGEYVMLAVSDDGSGISPEVLDKIFEPFFTTKGLDQGTGLGLSTVYGIAKQNKGFINVYSEPDKGTTIKIYLPRHTGQAVEAHSEKTLEIPLSKGETLLLVEDDGSILKLGERILENLGYIVLSANSPREAIKLSEEHAGEINLLITDVVMPEMNGRELSEQLRTICPDLKTLFMSGYTANVIAHRGVLEDGVCFISKPFSKKDMASKVREVLDEAKPKEQTCGRILVIEDEPKIRNLFIQKLSGSGYEIIEACDGKEGLKLYRENLPDLVITDLVMPEKEGVEMIIELKKEFTDAKIIAISGGGRNTPDSYLHIAKSLGAERTFSKPIDWPELIKTVNELLK